MDRRILLQGGGLILLSPTISGCLSSSSNQCVPSGDSLQDTICRQRAARDNNTVRLTAGMIIGAAIGASIALAFRSNPIVGAIGGAMAAGGAVALDAYLNYVREQANGDQTRMGFIIREDMRLDVILSGQAREDSETVIRETTTAMRNTDGKLLQNALRVDLARKAATIIKPNRIGFQRTADTYEQVGIKTDIVPATEVAPPVATIRSNAQQIEDDEKRLFADLG